MTTERKLMHLKCILKHDTVQRGQKKIGKCMQENRQAMRNKKKKKRKRTGNKGRAGIK